MTQVQLDAHRWTIGSLIASGGFGQVFAATGEHGEQAAVKLLPKDPSAERDLLFADLERTENTPGVVPILDIGETPTHWAIVMPLADRTLRQALRAGGLSADQAVEVMRDLLGALAALDGIVVHRDLKPENVLEVEGRWCLADFGIARYAEATTAPDTQKFSMTPPYAAPEQWRAERATAATDIYAFGVVAYELLTGSRPFPGPGIDDFRDQHLHDQAPRLPGDAGLSAVLSDCLLKAREARPTAQSILDRLDRLGSVQGSEALERLKQVNAKVASDRAEAAAEESRQQSERERREELCAAARIQLDRLVGEFFDQVTAAASAAIRRDAPDHKLRLGDADLTVATVECHIEEPDWGRHPPAFDVIASTDIELVVPQHRSGWVGRSASLWYCDAVEEDRYRWYEIAFMVRPLMRRRTKGAPVALPPSEDAGVALANIVGEWQPAWRFTPIDQGGTEAFTDRWLEWFSQGADGTLQPPNPLPEQDARGSYRVP